MWKKMLSELVPYISIEDRKKKSVILKKTKQKHEFKISQVSS